MGAACALLASSSDTNQAALNAVKAIPIILGLPFTFLLFWMCQGLLLVCKEEAGDLDINRKHFRTFLFNVEPMSFISMPAPFVGCGQVAEKIRGGNKVLYTVGYACIWLAMILLLFLGLADGAFAYMGASMFFMFCFAVGGLRVATR